MKIKKNTMIIGLGNCGCKITKLFAGNYQADIDYIEALFSADTTYTSFTGTIDGTKSTVKFIYETGAIKSDAEK